MKYKCHGQDNKGKGCENSIGFMKHIFGPGLCIDCEIDLLKLKIKQLKIKKEIERLR